MEWPKHMPQAILHGGRRGLTLRPVSLTTGFLPLHADSSDATSFCSLNRHQGIEANVDAPWTSKWLNSHQSLSLLIHKMRGYRQALSLTEGVLRGERAPEARDCEDLDCGAHPQSAASSIGPGGAQGSAILTSLNPGPQASQLCDLE